DEILDLLVAVALGKALANENAQIAGERCIRFVDGLVLADQAAEPRGEAPRALFQFRVAQDFIGLYGMNGRNQQQEEKQPPSHSAGTPAGTGFRFGAPTR